MLLAFAAVVLVSSAGEIAVDFTKETGKLNPALHSSGWTPRAYPRSISDDDEAVRSMNLTYARTHDWALFNPGQRVVDYQYIFPLMNKDPKDPSNYCFGPTDHLLQLSRNVGLKTFYRLGTSIEHTGKIHFNAAVPEDFDKVAEVFAGIVRHYNKGWANGKNWNIEYWEIWNEPDGVTSMWCDPEDTREWGKDQAADTAYENARKKRLQASFVKFFVTCLKRLKSEFPEIKVGGPALCWALHERHDLRRRSGAQAVRRVRLYKDRAHHQRVALYPHVERCPQSQRHAGADQMCAGRSDRP